MRYARGCLLVVLAWSLGAAQVRPTTTWIDYYSAASTMNGVPIPVGAVIQAFDPDGTLCGEFIVQNAGSYGFLHVYGDDPTSSGIDEGAVDGDTITFFIQGEEANGRAVWSAAKVRDTTEIHLHVILPPPEPPVLDDPAENEPSVSGPVVLTWSTTGPTVGTTTYQIQVALDSLFTSIIFDTTGVTGTSIILDILSGGTKYFWRVRTVNSITGTGSFEPGPMFTTSVTAELEVSSISIDLGETAVGSFSTGRFYLRNPSTVTVIVSSIGMSTSRFTVSPTNATISGGDSIAIDVTYQPDTYGSHVDTVVIRSNAEIGILAVPAHGVSPRPELTVSPGSIDFGTTNGDSAVIYLVSTGVNDVTVDTVYVRTQYYTLRLPAFPVVIASTETLSIRVFFSPDSIKEYPDTLYVSDNSATDAGSVAPRVALSGLGTTVTFTAENPGIPSAFDVGQNYPNPFNPTTTISFSIPIQSRVDVRIFTLLGQEVALLVDDIRGAGTYTVTFDARSLSSGMYFYTVKASADPSGGGEFTKTRRMILTK